MNTESLLSFLPLALVLLVCGLFWFKVKKDARKAPIVPQVLGSISVPDYKGPLAFFRQHFNGDYSLARSYWANTFLVSIFAPIVGLMLLPFLNERFPARYGSAGFLFITVLGIAAWFWAVSGTWASANKHVQRGGKAGWATAAKCMIVLGILRTFGDVGNMMPALQEHIKVAMGVQLGSDTKLELRADGRSILLTGGINDGSADQLENALQMAPSVTTVVLNSEGGWMREGQMLANVIRRHKLSTYVEGYCASACTIAFLAGADRAAAPTAKIGFHASRSVGVTLSTPTETETAKLRSIYREANLPDAFIRQALDTPSEKMWHPPHDVLLASGVLTRSSLGGETAALSTAVRSKDALAAEFKKTELFGILSDRSPKDFNDIVDVSWSKMQQGATDAEVTSAARTRITNILPRFLPLASDETLIDYQTLMQAELEALRIKDASACVEMVFPSGNTMLIAGNLPPELASREQKLMTRMLKEADPARFIKPSPKDVERVAQRAATDMTQEQVLAFSDEATRRRNPPSLVCDAAIKFFAGLNMIPLSERASALRILYAGNDE